MLDKRSYGWLFLKIRKHSQVNVINTLKVNLIERLVQYKERIIEFVEWIEISLYLHHDTVEQIRAF